MSRFLEIDRQFFVENIYETGFDIKTVRYQIFRNNGLRQIVEDWMSENGIRTPLCEILQGGL